MGAVTPETCRVILQWINICMLLHLLDFYSHSVITRLKYRLLSVGFGVFKRCKVSLNSCISLLGVCVWFMDCLIVSYFLWTTVRKCISFNVSHFPTCDSSLHKRYDSYVPNRGTTKTWGGGGYLPGYSLLPKSELKKKSDFVDTMISNVLLRLPFSRNQPLKLSDDENSGILKIKQKKT